jgi:hypothetical protein
LTDSAFFSHRLPALLAEVIDMYRASGRGLAGLEEDELDAQFLAAFRAYAAEQADPARFRAINDVAAEYVLRRRSAPIELVARELVSFVDLPGYEERLPLVLLAFGHFLVIPGFGMLLQLSGAAEVEACDRWPERDKDPEGWQRKYEAWQDEREAGQREFRWLLGLPS